VGQAIRLDLHRRKSVPEKARAKIKTKLRESKADALQAVTIIKALRLHASVLRGPPERPDDVLQNVSPRAGFVS
jgi:hypothetical protein